MIAHTIMSNFGYDDVPKTRSTMKPRPIRIAKKIFLRGIACIRVEDRRGDRVVGSADVDGGAG